MLWRNFYFNILTAITFSCAPLGAALCEVINIDIGNAVDREYAQLGALPDEQTHTNWNYIIGTGTNLVESDGSQSPVTVSITGDDFFPADQANIPNDLLNDYQYVSNFGGQSVGEIVIENLSANTEYMIYVYSAGNTEGQGAIIQLNNEYGVTDGAQSNTLEPIDNYTVIEVFSDGDGKIAGTYEPLKTSSSGVINGMQIAPSNLPTRILTASGADSPTVNLAGATIEVSLKFSEEVTLSQTGGATITLDFAGTQVVATHTGLTSGEELRFSAPAPNNVTAAETIIVQNSLALSGGSLVDEDGAAVPLSNPEFTLSNDQVSSERLSVYATSIPDPTTTQNLAESPYYRIRVRDTSLPSENWLSTFAWLTQAAMDDINTPGTNGSYEDYIGNWSHTYNNFEMATGVEVEIEITRLDPVTLNPIEIRSAVPQPSRKVKSWRVENGKAYVLIDKPVLLAVDIDGQFDRPSQLGQVNENALHAVSIFANPLITDKPPAPGQAGSDDVYYVTPGVVPPDDITESTYYFLPGVHQLFAGPFGDSSNTVPDDYNNGSQDDFRLRSNKNYYIPGDAIVHAAFNNEDDPSDGNNIRIYGHGTISGERIPHHEVLGLVNETDIYHLNKPLRINKAKGCRVEGITIADSANHSLALKSVFEARPENYSYVRWTKVFTWRANGDGISPNGSGFLEDSFVRTQDDGTYISGLGIRRNVYWSDVNGMALRTSNMLNDNPAIYKVVGDLIVKDIDVLFARGTFGVGQTGHAIIGYPSPPNAFQGNNGSHIEFKNIFVHDRFPTRRLFGMDTYTEEYDRDENGVATAVTGTEREARIPIAGVKFDNVRTVAMPALAQPPALGQEDFLGWTTATITGLVFKDVIRAGEHIGAMSDFTTNNNFTPGPTDPPVSALDYLPPVGGVVSGFNFLNVAPQAMSFVPLAGGYQKWFNGDNWDSGVAPAKNDIVNHTSSSSELVVDDAAFAGDLIVANAGTARVSIRNGGRLIVSNAITLGSPGLPGTAGEIDLIGGELIIGRDLSAALTINGGKINLAGGTLTWAGNDTSYFTGLLSSGQISVIDGRADPAPANATAIGQSGGNQIYALFENEETTVFVVKGVFEGQGVFQVDVHWLAILLLGSLIILLANVSTNRQQART